MKVGQEVAAPYEGGAGGGVRVKVGQEVAVPCEGGAFGNIAKASRGDWDVK